MGVVIKASRDFVQGMLAFHGLGGLLSLKHNEQAHFPLEDEHMDSWL